MRFFDRHDLFLRSSPVGNWPERLNARYEAIIAANRPLFAGARVLDLASHDGRWSFAALDAGARTVVGIEVRHELVDAANGNMLELNVAPDFFSFIAADLFERRDIFSSAFDVVLCLGIFYHTTRHVELLELIERTGAKTLILDTALTDQPGDLIALRAEDTDRPSSGFDWAGVRGGKILVGRPTAEAVELMLGHFGYAVRRFDWRALIGSMSLEPDLTAPQSASNPLGDYAQGKRGTFVATRKEP
jgi:Methyltransferase domain